MSGLIKEKLNAELGFSVKSKAEKIAQEAFGGENAYRTYAAKRQTKLDELRKDVTRFYQELVDEYITVGFSKRQAIEKAKPGAKAYKKIQMKVFHLSYPKAGVKVQKVF